VLSARSVSLNLGPGPPTLLLAGSADRFYGPELFAETAQLIPGSRLRVFERRGHITAAFHPEWSREITGFSRRATGRRSPARAAAAGS
jgi:pimeloyl-ACP methyl ester carboxylesterase